MHASPPGALFIGAMLERGKPPDTCGYQLAINRILACYRLARLAAYPKPIRRVVCVPLVAPFKVSSAPCASEHNAGDHADKTSPSVPTSAICFKRSRGLAPVSDRSSNSHLISLIKSPMTVHRFVQTLGPTSDASG
jgi:hypothetical protein